MKTNKIIAKSIFILLCLGFLVSSLRFSSSYDPIFYQKRLQPIIGVYYEVVTSSGYKEPSVFMIVNELEFKKVYDDLVVIPKRMREIELPYRNQIGQTGKYLTVITIDGVLTVKNFSNINELRAFKKL
ncbi:hypothetical protein H7Y21_01215 [Arenimonas sp.]|nr:hypothetical protein [Candidatus Parcubacteria bacterium]